MAKTISNDLLTDIRKGVTSLATLVEITRQDGVIYRLTNHDADIVFDGNTYRHDIPFTLSAIGSGSELSVDNTELSLVCDEVVFVHEEFKRGAFTHAEVSIFFVDWENPSHGRMTVRKGWFAPIESNEQKTKNITIVGLLKVLDFEVGRAYQPSCDADLGDRRCKVAIDHSQAYSALNPYFVGDWVYYYDPALMTQVSLNNGDFETDGVVGSGSPITGWTQSPGASFTVIGSNYSLAALQGSYALYGANETANQRHEQFVMKTVQLDGVAGADIAGLSTAFIDAGRYSLLLFVALAQPTYLLDFPRVRIEILDGSGNIIDNLDTRYVTLDAQDTWRERALALPLIAGARTLRIYLYMLKTDGNFINTAFDDVRLYYWDHTIGNPYDDVIHKVTRLSDYGDSYVYYPDNASFEVNGAVANSNAQDITGWTKSGYWSVGTALAGENAPDGDYFLIGGDDGGASQQTYTITQTKDLVTAYKLSTTRIDLGRVVGKFGAQVSWGDTTSAGKIVIEFLDVSNAVVSTVTVFDFLTNGTAPTTEFKGASFIVPATSRKVRLTLSARSPIGDGAANVAFDALVYNFLDSERPERKDLIASSGNPLTVFDTTVGSYTLDGNLIWKAHSAHVQYDTVAVVTDSKRFRGTNIVGSVGTYETALIKWLSGTNRGQKNLIRVFNPTNKDITLYFQSIGDIQVGDRFMYVRSCQKRFTSDSQLVFDNAINFRGFPYLPGRLSG